jgi:hypothetical protein
MHKSATKCNEILGKWCKNKHGASKIMDTLETYQGASLSGGCVEKPMARVKSMPDMSGANDGDALGRYPPPWRCFR